MIRVIPELIMKVYDIYKLRQSDSCPLNSLQAEYLIKSIEGTTMRIQKVEKLLYVAIVLILIIGCTNITTTTTPDGTHVATAAEMFAKLKYYNDKYCSVENTLVRETLVTIIHEKFPTYPVGGLCEEEHKFAEVLSTIATKP